jgi:hypothetical protein
VNIHHHISEHMNAGLSHHHLVKNILTRYLNNVIHLNVKFYLDDDFDTKIFDRPSRPSFGKINNLD